MGFMDEMMGEAMRESKKEGLISVAGADREKFVSEFKPIPDLKPGDKVRWKGPQYRNCRVPAIGEVVEVCTILNEKDRERFTYDASKSNALEVADFTLLFTTPEGVITQFTLDSRRFERV